MGSKYRANIGLNQSQMDKIAERFPEINDIEKFPTFAMTIQYLIDKIISGELIEKQYLTTQEMSELDKELKKQRVLDLKIKNRKQLIHDLKVRPAESIEITNGNLALEQSTSALARFSPESEVSKDYSKPENKSPIDISLTIGKMQQFKCVDCGYTDSTMRFDSTLFSSFDRAIISYRNHLDQQHKGRENTKIELAVISKLSEGCQ